MNDVSIQTLPRLSAATVEHIGPYMEVGKVFTQLFDWLNARQLAASDVRVFGAFYDDLRQVAPEKLRSRAAAVPSLEEYINDPRDTPAADLLTDIFIPLV